MGKHMAVYLGRSLSGTNVPNAAIVCYFCFAVGCASRPIGRAWYPKRKLV
jgi:hypothetical protein